ncbi:MAG: hypothetical protein CM1200mP34_5200 [Verrucomicrobiales bacterium]|nr:MAG: hypothetical protein CM1200mP34_5200 [Verrucomicrobiales bacterium]
MLGLTDLAAIAAEHAVDLDAEVARSTFPGNSLSLRPTGDHGRNQPVRRLVVSRKHPHHP